MMQFVIRVATIVDAKEFYLFFVLLPTSPLSQAFVFLFVL